MRSFQEASEFGGGKQSDVAGSPSPDNYRILLVDHLVENAREIFTQTRICCFPGHHAPPTRIVQHSCTAAEILYILVVRPTVFRGCAIVLSQADSWGVMLPDGCQGRIESFPPRRRKRGPLRSFRVRCPVSLGAAGAEPATRSRGAFRAERKPPPNSVHVRAGVSLLPAAFEPEAVPIHFQDVDMVG